VSILSHVLCSGMFFPNHIVVTHDAKSERVILPDLDALIDQEWARQQELARERGLPLYDANVYRLNDVTAGDDGLALHLAPEPYRAHATMKTLHVMPMIQDEHVDRVLVADALIRTRDNMFLFGHIQKLIETRTYLIGSTCTPERQVIATASDLWKYILQRVDLVLGIGQKRIWVGPLLGFVQDEVGCVHAIFDTEVDATHEEILERFQPGNGVGGLECVPADQLLPFLEAGEGYVPAVAAILAGR